MKSVFQIMSDSKNQELFIFFQKGQLKQFSIGIDLSKGESSSRGIIKDPGISTFWSYDMRNQIGIEQEDSFFYLFLTVL